LEPRCVSFIEEDPGEETRQVYRACTGAEGKGKECNRANTVDSFGLSYLKLLSPRIYYTPSCRGARDREREREGGGGEREEEEPDLPVIESVAENSLIRAAIRARGVKVEPEKRERERERE